jgi:hypothetical protein
MDGVTLVQAAQSGTAVTTGSPSSILSAKKGAGQTKKRSALGIFFLTLFILSVLGATGYFAWKYAPVPFLSYIVMVAVQGVPVRAPGRCPTVVASTSKQNQLAYSRCTEKGAEWVWKKRRDGPTLDLSAGGTNISSSRKAFRKHTIRYRMTASLSHDCLTRLPEEQRNNVREHRGIVPTLFECINWTSTGRLPRQQA